MVVLAILIFIFIFLFLSSIYLKILKVKINIFMKFFLVITLVLILLDVAYIRNAQLKKNTLEKRIISAIAMPVEKSVKAIQNVVKRHELEKIVSPIVEKADGTYGIGIKNLKTGEEFYLNETKKFETASLYKLWVMATVYKQIEDGTLTNTASLSADVKTLNERFKIDEENAEIKEGVISNSLKGALYKMITVSDNYSAYLLSSKVRYSNITKLLREYNFDNSSINPIAATNVNDMVVFYEKLYNKELVSEDASIQMLELLKQQQRNDRIPKYLPDGTAAAHKTGELDSYKHDAGIVFSPKGDYIIVMLSSTSNLNTAAEVEAKISKAVWDYFEKG